MALVAFKCVAELSIKEITAPGIRLANKDELFLNVCMLGQQRRTRLVSPYFPLEFYDTLRFEKTFKCCRDICDVVSFLSDLNVLIELIQLGTTQNDEVLACYSSNAKQFLYPTPDTNVCYNCSKRNLFMVRGNQLPGSICPQLKFYVSLRIYETPTPASEIINEYANRYVDDPIIEISRRANQAKARGQVPKRNRIVKSKNKRIAELIEPLGENFASHTISSALKADYGHFDVRAKLEELNDNIKRTRVIKNKPEYEDDAAPFVVRHVQDSLITRNPKSHAVLSDGLVVTRKNSYRNQRSRSRSRSRSAPGSRSLSRQSRGSSLHRSRSNERIVTPNFHLNHNHLMDSQSSIYQRSRSLSPNAGCRHLSCEHMTVSDCERPSSILRRRGSNPRVNFTSSSFTSPKRARSAHNSRTRLSRSRTPSSSRFNTKVGSFSKLRNPANFDRHNSGAIFGSSSSLHHTKDPFNQTVLLRSGRASGKRTHPCIKTRKSINTSDIDYHRYYPWLSKYSNYLENLESQLECLRMQSQLY